MSQPERNTDYDNFAWFYNKHWSARLIDQIFQTIDKHLLTKLKPGSHILDVCCGNAHLSSRMSREGFRVTGIDASDEMLRYARQNSPESAFHLFDARDFTLDEKFDAAVCTCDSFNHIMTIEELDRALENVFKALKPGGRFLFDLNTEEGYKKYWNSATGGRAEPDNAFIVKLSYNETNQESTFESTMFRLIEGQWQRFDARLTQQYYPKELILETLEKIGFTDMEFYDVEKDLGVDGTGRMMFVMQKR